MKRTSLSANFTYWPPKEPRASFDEPRDLEEKKSKIITAEGLEEKMVEFDADEEEIGVEVEGRWFAFEIESCPPSLKLFVRIFRFFLFSFSGIVFKTTTSSLNKVADSSASSTRRPSALSQHSTSGPPPTRSILSRFISILTLFLHIALLSSYIFPLIIGPIDFKKAWKARQRLLLNSTTLVSSNSTSPPSFSHSFNIEEFFGKDEYWTEFAGLKPILRNITKSVMYIFIIDGLLQFGANLLLGGRLIGRITGIPGIHSHDGNVKLAIQLFCGTITFVVSFTFLGLIIYNKKQLKTLAEIVVGGRTAVGEDDLARLLKTSLIISMHLYHYIVLSMVAMLFVYTMIIGQRVVDSVRAEVTEDLTEPQLLAIRNRLTTFSTHFTGIIRLFALPLTTAMISNALLIIGSTCFLMIHKFQDNDYFIVFIFNLGAFAFCRLVIVCTWGNAVMNAHRELVREIYESMAEWSLPTWMAFLEIKRLGEKFEVNIGGIYSVKQSAILTVLGFALNYIVVLLQTENYGGKGEWGGGEEGNVSVNSSIN